MNTEFKLDPKLENDGSTLIDLPLCRVILVNNSLFPWVILVPRVSSVYEIIDLADSERIRLIQEISMISKVMQAMFKPDKLNIAALGNIVPQLHIHIIARFKDDAAWPDPVFGKGKAPYHPDIYNNLSNTLRSATLAASNNH